MGDTIGVLGNASKTAITATSSPTADAIVEYDAMKGITGAEITAQSGFTNQGTNSVNPAAIQTANFNFGNDTHVPVNCAGGAVTGNLPAATGETYEYIAFVYGNTVNAFTITATSGTIIGPTTFNQANVAIRCFTDGSNWYVSAVSNPPNVAPIQTSNFNATGYTDFPVNCTGGTINGQLPAASAGKATVYFYPYNNSSNAFTLTAVSGTIIGSVSITTPNKWVRAVSDGTNWYVG
ncbi:MAG: hypothetical protein ABSF29_12640 [Tepidisphaeraceae bacterium]|jgi:hypothetical protein